MICSLSGLALLAACPGSASLPHQRRESSAANLGSAIHEWIEMGIRGPDVVPIDIAERWDLDERDAGRLAFVARHLRLPVPASARHELALGMWPDGSVRSIRGARGMYEDAGQIVGGTLDLVWLEGDTVWVADIKTGSDEHVTPIARNWQLRAGALLAARHLGAKRAIPAICYVNAAECSETVERAETYEGRWEVGATLDAAALDGIEDELRAVQARAGNGPALILGPHCEFCDARAACPAFTAEARALSAQAQAGGSLAVLTRESATHLVEIMPAMRRMLDAAEEACRAYVEAHGPLVLSDGKTYGPAEEPTTSYRTEEALGVLEDAFGPSAALLACAISEDGIKRAMREGLGVARLGRGAFVEMQNQIRDAGGIEVGSRVMWRRRHVEAENGHKAEASVGASDQVGAEHGSVRGLPGAATGDRVDAGRHPAPAILGVDAARVAVLVERGPEVFCAARVAAAEALRARR